MRKFSLATAICAAAFLTGCGSLADSLGLGRNPPDEFSVVERPPLALPPDFALRPPRPGAPRPQEMETNKRANLLLFGDKTSNPDGDAPESEVSLYDSEKALLQSAGAENAAPEIRETIDKEASQKAVGSRRLIDDLLWWKEPTAESAVVDAPAEAERIKETKKEDEPINKGATPIIERRKSGWLE